MQEEMSPKFTVDEAIAMTESKVVKRQPVPKASKLNVKIQKNKESPQLVETSLPVLEKEHVKSTHDAFAGGTSVLSHLVRPENDRSFDKDLT